MQTGKLEGKHEDEHGKVSHSPMSTLDTIRKLHVWHLYYSNPKVDYKLPVTDIPNTKRSTGNYHTGWTKKIFRWFGEATTNPLKLKMKFRLNVSHDDPRTFEGWRFRVIE